MQCKLFNPLGCPRLSDVQQERLGSLDGEQSRENRGLGKLDVIFKRCRFIMSNLEGVKDRETNVTEKVRPIDYSHTQLSNSFVLFWPFNCRWEKMSLV